jgi:hypothetical protein
MQFNVLEAPDSPINDCWIRLPHPKSRCPHTGLARTTLLELVLRSKGKIKTVNLRKPGAVRGVRLIHLPSLQDYLVGLAELQKKEGSHSEAPNISGKEGYRN